MAEETGKSQSGSSLNGWAALIFLILAATIVAVTWMTADKFKTAADTVAVLAAILGPLSAIAAGVFGVKLSSDAKADTQAAQEKIATTKAEVRNLGGRVEAFVSRAEATDAIVLPDAEKQELIGVQEHLRKLAG